MLYLGCHFKMAGRKKNIKQSGAYGPLLAAKLVDMNHFNG
jgi:hypothetical protein